ncbi:hypothetical protein FHU38_005040 [Saccharomonospora amisosensis]|uniref:Excalibur calcium-binding domain-containing protein n=1 Tax=Saccharomonospora amisosensis TaxID=1128677 RepID=A0A7X5UVX8_9PSEU|nr:excalibur calcium-binding domain-containing protein [Saccharomonospora amisosensis]NIJ14639.1 hypothetical protein [Saccharomonospora amisosensis]
MRLRQAAAVLVLAAGASLTLAGTATAQDRGLDCPNFPNQAEAQKVYNQDTSDPHRLDADNDGIACERNGPPSLTSVTTPTTTMPTTSPPTSRPTETHSATSTQFTSTAAGDQVQKMPSGAVAAGDGSSGGGPGAAQVLFSLAGLGVIATTTAVAVRRGRKTS